MNKVNDKKLKHLKRKSIWPPIISFFLSIIVGGLLVALTVSATLSYVIESKYVDSVDTVYQVQKTITEKMENGLSMEEALTDIQNGYTAPDSICIYDEDNNLVCYYGDIVNQSSSVILNDQMDMHPFFSTKDGPAFESKDEELYVNVREVVMGFKSVFSDNKGDIDSIRKLKKSYYTFDYWVTDNHYLNGYTIYAKIIQSFTYNDCFGILVVAIVAGIICAMIAIGSLVNAISNIVSQRKLLKLLLRDPITDGNNYLAFKTYTERTLTSPFKQKYSYALVNISLIKYQSYCTLYGTTEGENLLASINSGLRNFIQKGEYVGRHSNADFLLLLKLSDGSDANNLLECRINNIMANLPNQLRLFVTPSKTPLQGLNNIRFKAGVYIIPAATDEDTRNRRKRGVLEVDQLHIKTTIAMSSLEDSGLIFYNHDMWVNDVWEQKVQDKMYDALANEEFQVYIQPKYNPVTDELAGGEALVRWISPEDGFISPGQFIPIFEKTGFVTRLDDYMISHTAALQAKWQQEGKKIVPISVNVSRAHFAQPDLAEHIKELVDAYPVSHEFIEIELTESAFFDDKNALLTTVRKLQEYGFEVSMDDFGSGYSSLNSLKDLPLNVLKLDAEFFRGDDFDTRGEIVVAEAITLAKQLNMRIVAEGVEKKEQVDFLAKQNCDMIQGYYYAKPMPADEYESRMK